MEAEVAAGDDVKQMEERFLSDLGQRPVPLSSLLGVLRFLHGSGQTAVADSWAQALRDVLIEQQDGPAMLRLVKSWAVWRTQDRSFGTTCREMLRKASKDRLWAALVDSAGFGDVPLAEALRRMDLLVALKPGVAVLDKTWGFGIVKRLDDFYKRIAIDFSSKPGHALTLAYAGEGLSLVDDQHLLAVRHRDAAGLAKKVREDAAEVVRMALRSFGPMPVARLETTLAEHKIVAASDWKRFWDAARKGLKGDLLVDVPTRRTEPLTIRSEATRYDETWFEAFRAERDSGEILRGVLTLEGAVDPATLEAAAKSALSDRLAFAIKGAHNTDAALYTRLALAVRRLRLDSPALADLRAHLWEGNRYISAAEALPGRDVGQMVDLLLDDPEAPGRLLATIPDMPFNLVSEALERLAQGTTSQQTQLRCRELLSAPTVPPPLLVWVLRNREEVAAWPLPSLYEQLAHAIAIVEDSTLTGEMLRMQNTLRGLFENARWFESAFGSLTSVQRQAIFDRIQGASGVGGDAAQRALVGRMIKLDPSLAERKRATGQAAEPKAAGRWTSWRSLLQRQAQLKHLVEVEIPRNSQDIATARSYGDLRENFEYHAAKHQQGLLMQRRDEWDRELKQVRGTDFASADTQAVGMGVMVRLRGADGAERRYSILGEWDRDETLNIISNRSRLAQMLEGKKAGEAAIVPGESGDETVTIVAVEPLDADVRAWIGSGQPA